MAKKNWDKVRYRFTNTATGAQTELVGWETALRHVYTVCRGSRPLNGNHIYTDRQMKLNLANRRRSLGGRHVDENGTVYRLSVIN